MNIKAGDEVVAKKVLDTLGCGQVTMNGTVLKVMGNIVHMSCAPDTECTVRDYHITHVNGVERSAS